jgi:hypothetical protein
MRYAMTSFVLCTMLLAGASLPIARSAAPNRPSIGQAPGDAPQDQIRELRGTVKTVDRETKALRIAHLPADVADTMLLMTDDTQVQTEGRWGSLADIQRGTRIRASYQDRYGINVARLIEITG